MRADLQRATEGNPALRSALEEIQSQIASLQPVSTVAGNTPAPFRFTVKGEDGNFTIEISNPDDKSFQTIQQRQLWNSYLATGGKSGTHQLQSCLTRDFDDAGQVKTYGPDPRVRWEISDTPDESRYWRIRSSYNGSTWSRWAEYVDPVFCGAVPVWSGQVRSTRQMPNAQLNVTNYATVDSVDVGGGVKIRVYGTGGPGSMWYRQVGSITEGPFPAAELSTYAYATKYWVYYDKPQKIFRVYTDAEYSKTLDDRYRLAGYFETVAAGGGGGTPGGGGGGGGRGGCVEVGVEVEFSAGDVVEEIVEPCSDWATLIFPNWDELPMHPDTLVKVWKKAKELQPGIDRIGIGDGNWTTDYRLRFEHRDSQKVVRKCRPSQEYKAGKMRVNLHNNKPLESPGGIL